MARSVFRRFVHDGGVDRRDDEAEAEARDQQRQRERSEGTGLRPRRDMPRKPTPAQDKPRGGAGAQSESRGEVATRQRADRQRHREAHEVEAALQGGAVQQDVGEQRHVDHRHDQRAAGEAVDQEGGAESRQPEESSVDQGRRGAPSAAR